MPELLLLIIGLYFEIVLGGIIFLKKENVKGKLRFFISDKRAFDARAVCFSQLPLIIDPKLTETLLRCSG